MKKSLRSVQKAVNPKSAKERCTGARITGPVAGTFSRPATRGRNHRRSKVVKMTRMRRYPSLRVGSMANSWCLPGAGTAAGLGRAHSHDSTSSTTSCGVRPVVSRRWASGACCSGDAVLVESIRSRRATSAADSSWRRRARSSADAVR